MARPMNRSEAMEILMVEEVAEGEDLDPENIMERFNKLMEKNTLEKGGSFYL